MRIGRRCLCDGDAEYVVRGACECCCRVAINADGNVCTKLNWIHLTTHSLCFIVHSRQIVRTTATMFAAIWNAKTVFLVFILSGKKQERKRVAFRRNENEQILFWNDSFSLEFLHCPFHFDEFSSNFCINPPHCASVCLLIVRWMCAMWNLITIRRNP